MARTNWTEEEVAAREREMAGDGIPISAKTSEQLEREIERDCTAWLELDGWRPLRTDPVSDRRRGKGFGELGMADHLYIRYSPSGVAPSWNGRPRCDVLWIEYKRPGTVPTPHQEAWHARERARGALTLMAGVDFEPTLEGLKKWYQASGLMRRQGGDVSRG